MPSMVINRNDAQYGTETMVFIATHGVYNVMPSMNRFRTMNVADARRRTNLLLNLEILKKNVSIWNILFLCYKSTSILQ